jgi:hypothetical protein
LTRAGRFVTAFSVPASPSASFYESLACAAPPRALWLPDWAFTGWLAVVLAVSVFIFVKPVDAVYAWIGLQVLPLDWNMTLFGMSWAAFASYFVFVAACVLARRRGAFSWAQRHLACGRCRRQPSLHRRLRAEWSRQLHAVTRGGKAEAGSHAAVVVASPLRAMAVQEHLRKSGGAAAAI